jgi:hypothetical protein
MSLAFQALIYPCFGDRLSSSAVQLVEIVGQGAAACAGQGLGELEEMLVNPSWLSEWVAADLTRSAPAAGVPLHELLARAMNVAALRANQANGAETTTQKIL